MGPPGRRKREGHGALLLKLARYGSQLSIHALAALRPKASTGR
jgi:hypothetical protein